MKILGIVGPTGGGKSAVAMALAEQLNGEILSCDSMQIYRGMDIGTAKPSREEQERVRHYLIDIVDPSEAFSCSDYVTAAQTAVAQCAAQGKLPIFCGGTGLYLDALLRENGFEPNTTDERVRTELQVFADRNGAEALHRELALADPESAAAIHPNNVKRVVRALEIYRVCGITKTELDRRSQTGGMRYDACVIGLRYSDRSVLYEQIDRRVEQMMADGLAEETRRLNEQGVFACNHTAAQAIGYKELLPYLQGKETRSCAVENLKTATRRYAKRQMTWFSAKPYVRWLDVTENGRKKTFEEIVNNAKALFQNFASCDIINKI